VLRAEPTMSKEKGEVYYITPNGKKLRTRHEIQSHLHDDLTINNFTLVKEAIGASPEDEIIRPAKYYNYARRSNVEPIIEPSQPPLGKRIPKPKMPKGASPPPQQNQQQNSLNSPTPSFNTPTLKFNVKENNNQQDASKNNSARSKSSTNKSKSK
jgi:hypothetical protein